MTSSEPPGPGAVTVSADQASTLLAALYVAAGYHHDRAELCTDCADQSCATCQWRLQAAGTYDQLAAQIIQAAEASATPQQAPGHPAAASGGPHAAADPEAGQ